MKLTRRTVLQLAGAACCARNAISWDRARAEEHGPSIDELDAACAAPVLNASHLTSPIVIESIELLKGQNDFFVRIRSKDGAEGISVANSRAAYLYPIFNRLVAPYFVGKDARHLEDHLFGVYRHSSNAFSINLFS